MEMNSQFWPILFLSLRVSGLAVAISSIIGLPLGVWLGLRRFRGKSILVGLVQTGMAMPPVVVGLLLYLLLFTPAAMILAQVLLCLPFVVGISMAAVAAVPRELQWQLRSVGASERQSQWAMVCEARTGILLAVATAFGRSLSEVGAVWLVGGNIEGQTRVMTTAIVLETGKGHFTLALLLGAALLGVALAINIVIVRYQWRALP